MSTSTLVARQSDGEADPGTGVRLSVPVGTGEILDEIAIEPGHCERLFRTAVYVAIRDGLVAPDDRMTARLVPGRVRDRHGAVYCLDSCCVELLDGHGRLAARVGFPRSVFAAFATARVFHLLAEPRRKEAVSVAYSLHAVEGAEEPLPVEIPTLPSMSVAALAGSAIAHGNPADDWVMTFVTPEASLGFEKLERLSRVSGLEAAGRIHTRVGFDKERRCFLRVLESLVISRQTIATDSVVVSTGASWVDFLAGRETVGPQAFSAVHTHVHFKQEAGGPGHPSGDPVLADEHQLGADSEPCISISDIVTHYTAFPDPLSAALIVSLFPDRRVVKLYGYTPDALLQEEPGYWALTDTPGTTVTQQER